jgi:hypothetical protein
LEEQISADRPFPADPARHQPPVLNPPSNPAIRAPKHRNPLRLGVGSNWASAFVVVAALIVILFCAANISSYGGPDGGSDNLVARDAVKMAGVIETAAAIAGIYVSENFFTRSEAVLLHCG